MLSRFMYTLTLVLSAATACKDRSADATKGGATPTDGVQIAQPSSPQGAPADAAGPAPRWRQMTEDWTYPDPIPNYQLIDHSGRRFELRELADAFVVVGFIFTRCGVPEACPETMKRMRQVQELWTKLPATKNPDHKKLRLLTLTLDPEFDSPEVLRQFGTAYGADLSTWQLATGPRGLMEDDLPSLFGVMAVKGADQQIAHTVKIALLAPGLRHLSDWQDNKVEAQAIVDLVLEHEPETEPASE